MKFELLQLVALSSLCTIDAQPPQQSLDEVLLMVFDDNKDGSVTMPEISNTMSTVQGMMGDMNSDPSNENSDTQNMVKAAVSAAPAIFEFLDGDSSQSLSPKELKWLAKAQSGFKSGAMLDLAREVFATIDANSDNFLDAPELDAAAADDEILSTIAGLVHAAYPVRKDVGDLKSTLKKKIEDVSVNGASAVDGISYIDTNKDGMIDKKEVGKAYSRVKKMFLSGAKTVQEMGPMFAMMGGMGGMGGEF